MRWAIRPPEDRFWEKVAKGDGCWLWRGATRNGYGHFLGANRQRVYSHRFAWEVTHGPIPTGLLVCHHCDVRLCVRPDHLFLGTDADNLRDMGRKGRGGSTLHPERLPHGANHWNVKQAAIRTSCKWGHPYPENRSRFGGCIECRRRINREYMRRQSAH